MPEDKSPTTTTTGDPVMNLDAPAFFLNRELSWLEFNSRVLEEAERAEQPLLERAKFLAIYFNNLDEFFMIRVSGLREQLSGGVLDTSPDGMTPADQLAAIGRVLQDQLVRVVQTWERDLRPALYQAGVHLLELGELTQDRRLALRDYFAKEIFPTLTPLAFDPAHPFPHISNISLNLAVVARDPEKGTCFARIKVPDLFPRLVPVPATVEEATTPSPGAVLEAPPHGAVIRILTIEPFDDRRDSWTPNLHCDDSLHVITMTDGEIDVVLEEGEVRLTSGDSIVLPGSVHDLRNLSGAPASFVYTSFPLRR